MLQNVQIADNKDTIVLTIRKDHTVAEAGSDTKSIGKDGKPKPRKNDLVATSGGFVAINPEFSISLNVNRVPKTT